MRSGSLLITTACLLLTGAATAPAAVAPTSHVRLAFKADVGGDFVSPRSPLTLDFTVPRALNFIPDGWGETSFENAGVSPCTMSLAISTSWQGSATGNLKGDLRRLAGISSGSFRSLTDNRHHRGMSLQGPSRGGVRHDALILRTTDVKGPAQHAAIFTVRISGSALRSHQCSTVLASLRATELALLTHPRMSTQPANNPGFL